MNEVKVLYRNYHENRLKGEVRIGEEGNITTHVITIADISTPGQEITLLPYPQTVDFNGNGKVDLSTPGLYFCANVRNGTLSPPRASPYGKHRISIDINKLDLKQYTPYRFNTYPLPNNDQEYAIIALVLKEDLENKNKICNLPETMELDWNNNQYLFQENGGTWYVSGTVWVELFIINEITIKNWVYEGNIMDTGRA